MNLLPEARIGDKYHARERTCPSLLLADPRAAGPPLQLSVFRRHFCVGLSVRRGTHKAGDTWGHGNFEVRNSRHLDGSNIMPKSMDFLLALVGFLCVIVIIQAKPYLSRTYQDYTEDSE